MKVNYILPDFLAYSRNSILIYMLENYNFIYNDNVNIYSFYGTFSQAVWNGGRVDKNDKKATIKFMKKVRDFYNNHGVKISFTFTNCLIEEKHLQDKYCNDILDVFHNGMNEIIIVSPVLEEYIRKKYPKYKINRSITFVDQENPYDTNRYDLSIIDKSLNRDIDRLKKIKDKCKIEFLCDEICVNDCEFTKRHYTEISREQLGLPLNSNEKLCGKCRHYSKFNMYDRQKTRNETSKYYISPNDIKNIYVPMGFKYFKLSGREKFNVVGYQSIINYLIKPKYQLDMKIFIFESMLNEAKVYYENKIYNF